MPTARLLRLAAVLAVLPATAVAETQLVASAPIAGERLGTAVALSGGLAVAGAPRDAGEVAPGRALVFRAVDGGWVEEAALTAADAFAQDGFGAAVATDGVRVAVGAPATSAPAQPAGAVYVFVQAGGAWVQEARLAAADASAGDGFGLALALRGDALLVGAPQRAAAGAVGAGAAYVFRRDAAGWTQEALLLSADVDAFDGLGTSVALDGARAALGAPGDDDLGGLSGAAYVFERVAGAWLETDKLLAADGGPLDRFGTAAALDDDTLVVGAPLWNDRGTGYVFERGPGGFAQTARLEPVGVAYADGLGVSVAVQGPIAALGAPFADPARPQAGAAWVFHRGGAGWLEAAALSASDGSAADHLGFQLALDGDALLAGAPGVDPPAAEAGAAYVLTVPLPEIGTPYCFGLASACPCGNGGGAGRGCANSTGVGARLSARLSASVAADALRLAAEDLPPGRPALAFAGTQASGGGGGLPFGDGLRCAGGGVVRLGTSAADGAGAAAWGPGLVALGGFAPGELWRLQVWYRDPLGGPCGAGFNLTNGVALAFEP